MEKDIKPWSVIMLGSSFICHWILISDFSPQLKEMMNMKRLKPIINERATNDAFKLMESNLAVDFLIFLN